VREADAGCEPSHALIVQTTRVCQHADGLLEEILEDHTTRRQIGETFVVRDVQALMPELAYTTVMTTLHRLAGKGMLAARAEPGRRRDGAPHHLEGVDP